MRKNSFCNPLSGPNQMKSPIRLAKLSPTEKWKFQLDTSSPTTSMSRGSPQPRPASWARRMYWIDSGSKPMILAATASIAT